MLAAGLARQILADRGVPYSPAGHPSVALELLREERPGIVVVGTAENPDSLGLHLIAAARELGIESVGIVDAHGNADLRFRGRSRSPLTYMPDWVCVPLPETRQVYIRMGLEPGRVVACGHPHWSYVIKTARQFEGRDRIQMRQRLFPGIGRAQKALVFVSEGCARLKPRDEAYFRACTIPAGPSAYGRTEMVLDLFLDEIKGVEPRPYLALRGHPKDTETDYERYSSRLDKICRDNAPLEMLFAADFVVGMTSSLMMEAVIMGRPTLSIVPREDETVILPAIGMGLVPWVGTASGLAGILPDFLSGQLRLSESRAYGGMPEDPLAVIGDLVITRLNEG